MNFKIKNITTTITSVILIITILTLNIPILIHLNCSNMDISSCTCNKVNEEKSCCEKTSRIELTINSSTHCGCYISEADNNRDFYDNQSAVGNKLNIFEKTFYTVNLIYHYNYSSNHESHIHSPPLISNSPLYISIHSLLI